MVGSPSFGPRLQPSELVLQPSELVSLSKGISDFTLNAT